MDELIEQSLGGFGPSHLLQSLLVSLPLLFDAQQTFISVFTDAVPSWHCTDHDQTPNCNSNSDICTLSKSSWSWDGPSDQTIVSQWSLECATFVTGLPSSSFFMGCLLGGFALSTLGDSWLGRKKLLFFSCLAMSLSAFASIYSPNVWIYSALRFVCGFFRSSIMTTALVLLMEMVGKRWRGQIGIIAFFFFTFGLLSLPAIAYANKGKDSSWKILYFWTSIPSIVCCILAYFFVSESPRWLFLQGREDEAMAILKMFGDIRFNSSQIPNLLLEKQSNNFGMYASLKDLFRRKWALKTLAASMALGFGIGMAYYGMLLGVGNLEFTTYLSLTLNGLLDIPSYFLTFLLIGKCKRTSSMLTFCIASGVFSIVCGVVSNHEQIQLGVELAAFFSCCTAFNVLLIYVTEMFPTSVRNSGTSMVRQALLFGAALSPAVISAGRGNELVCYGVLGLVILCCGLIAAWLPETRGMPLFDTLDEQEQCLD